MYVISKFVALKQNPILDHYEHNMTYPGVVDENPFHMIMDKKHRLIIGEAWSYSDNLIKEKDIYIPRKITLTDNQYYDWLTGKTLLDDLVDQNYDLLDKLYPDDMYFSNLKINEFDLEFKDKNVFIHTFGSNIESRGKVVKKYNLKPEFGFDILVLNSKGNDTSLILSKAQILLLKNFLKKRCPDLRVVINTNKFRNFMMTGKLEYLENFTPRMFEFSDFEDLRKK